MMMMRCPNVHVGDDKETISTGRGAKSRQAAAAAAAAAVRSGGGGASGGGDGGALGSACAYLPRARRAAVDDQ